MCVSGQLDYPASLYQARVSMLFVDWEAGWVAESVRPLAPVGNRTTFLGLPLFGIVTRRTVRVILYSCETCVLRGVKNMHFSVDKKNQLDFTFVFFISLLLVAQHVSGNHVSIIRS